MNKSSSHFDSVSSKSDADQTHSHQGASMRSAVFELMRLLWNHSTKGRWLIVCSLLLLLLAKGLELLVPLLYSRIVDHINIDQPDLVLVPSFLILAYVVVRIIARLFSELRDTLFVLVAQPTMRLCLLNAFERLHSLSMRFHLTRRTGQLSRSLERGSRGIEFLLRFMLFNILPTALEIVFVLCLMARLFGIDYSAVLLATLAIFVIWTLYATEWRLKFRRKMNEADNSAYGKAVDSLLNYETVKIFGREDFESKRFNEHLLHYQNATIKNTLSLMVLNMGQVLCIAIGSGILMWMAAADKIAGELSTGEFVLVGSYLIMLFQPLNFMGFVYREIRRSITDMEDLFLILTHKPEIVDADCPLPLPKGPVSVEFDHISFDYEPGQPILKELSLYVQKGSKVAIVGPSGSGKSTLVRLLLRFYDTKKGVVRLSGIDTRNLRLDDLRSCIGVVPQDTVLFNDTIYNNVAYGNPDASDKQIKEAIKASNLKELVETLKDGYETLVGERGLKLSGGEKQRVAIARVILKNPRLLILDEATSSLDSDNEKLVMHTMNNLMHDRTTLIIAHRLSTVTDCDLIFVVDKGQIVEEGTHEELLSKKSGLYANLWAQQAKESQNNQPQ